MRVRMLTKMAGPRGVVEAGRIVDLPDHVAGPLLAGGYAEALAAEEATIEAPETAELPAKRRKRRPSTGSGRSAKRAGRSAKQVGGDDE